MPFSAVWIRIEPKIIANGEREAADLADRLRDSPRPPRDARRPASRAPSDAAGLLVGGEDQPDRPPRRHAGTGPSAYDAEHHRVEVLHVDCAAAPDAAVDRPRRRTAAPTSRPRWPAPRRDARAPAAAAAIVSTPSGSQCATTRRPPRRRTRSSSPAMPTSSSSSATRSAACRSPGPGVRAEVRGVDPESAPGTARQPRRPAGNPRSPIHLCSCGDSARVHSVWLEPFGAAIAQLL